MFAVVLTGPPGAGKTVALTALSDALVADRVEHAAVDVDEIAWGYPFPTLEQRCEYLRACCESHRRMGHRTLLVAEVIESAGHLRDVLRAIGADDLLLVRLDARLAGTGVSVGRDGAATHRAAAARRRTPGIGHRAARAG